jgi:hypothetical protein
MTEEHRQDEQGEQSQEEQRNTAFLKSVWRDFFAEQERKSEAAPTEK